MSDTPESEGNVEAVDATADAAPKKKSFKEKFSDFIAEYGAIGFVTWFGILGITVVGFAIAFQFGLDIGRDADDPPLTGGLFESGAIWAAAYIASQAAKPLRILATFALTPILARAWKRIRGQDGSDDETSAEAPSEGSDAGESGDA